MTELRYARDDFSRQFESLEAVMMDPLLRQAFDKIATYNELLQNQSVTLDQINEIVNELDEEWLELLGQEAEMTGLASFMMEDADEPGPDSVRREYYENQTVSFRGVLARPLEEGREDDEVAPRKYQLRIGLAREGLDRQANHLMMYGSAAIEDIISLEFEHYMSPERARNWLEYHYPEVIADIDHEVLKEAEDECERIMRLADYAWQLSDASHGTDEQFLYRTKAALQVYLDSLFGFDHAIGYELVAEGVAWLHHTSGEMQGIRFSAAALASVHSVQWEAAPDDDEELIRPHLRMLLHHDDKDETPLEMTIPLRSIEHFASIRSSFYRKEEGES